MAEYLYINTVVNEVYQEITSYMNSSLLSTYKTDINNYVCNNECLNNPLGLESTYCFFSINRKKALPLLFFSKSALKKNAISSCYYSQSVISDRTDTEDSTFSNLIFHPFFTESQLDDIAKGSSILLENGNDNLLADNNYDVDIAAEAIKTILYRAMLRWLMGEKQIKIAVPEVFCTSTDAYNGFVLNAANKIFSYFPFALRNEAGFASFLDANKAKNLSRIYMVFVSEKDADSDTIFLDGSSRNAYDRLLNNTFLPDGIKTLIDHIVSFTNKNTRDVFLTGLHNVEMRENFSPIDYNRCGEELVFLLNQVSADNIVDYSDYIESVKNNSSLLKPDGDLDKIVFEALSENAIPDYISRNAHSKQEVIDCLVRIKPLLSCCKEIKNSLWSKYSDSFIEKISDKNSPLDELKSIYGFLEKNAEFFAFLADKATYELSRNAIAEAIVSNLTIQAKSDLEKMNNDYSDASDYNTAAKNRIETFRKSIDDFPCTFIKTGKPLEKITAEYYRALLEKYKSLFDDIIREHNLDRRKNRLERLNEKINSIQIPSTESEWHDFQNDIKDALSKTVIELEEIAKQDRQKAEELARQQRQADAEREERIERARYEAEKAREERKRDKKGRGYKIATIILSVIIVALFVYLLTLKTAINEKTSEYNTLKAYNDVVVSKYDHLYSKQGAPIKEILSEVLNAVKDNDTFDEDLSSLCCNKIDSALTALESINQDNVIFKPEIVDNVNSLSARIRKLTKANMQFRYYFSKHLDELTGKTEVLTDDDGRFLYKYKDVAEEKEKHWIELKKSTCAEIQSVIDSLDPNDESIREEPSKNEFEEEPESVLDSSDSLGEEEIVSGNSAENESSSAEIPTQTESTSS